MIEIIVILVLVGGTLLVLVGVPLLAAAGYILMVGSATTEAQRAKEELARARLNKIRIDSEIAIDARLPKLASEVAMLELKIQEKRKSLGLDDPFTPDNYK